MFCVECSTLVPLQINKCTPIHLLREHETHTHSYIKHENYTPSYIIQLLVTIEISDENPK